MFSECFQTSNDTQQNLSFILIYYLMISSNGFSLGLGTGHEGKISARYY